MAVRERAALGVLAGEPDRDAVDERASANASDSAWPQSIPPSSRAVTRRSSWRSELRVDREPGRHAQQLLGQPPQALLADAGLDRGRPAGRHGLVARLRRDVLAERRAQPVVRLAQPCDDAPRRARVGLLRAEHALLDELRAVELAHRRVAARSARPSAAACRRARPARCGRSGGSRRGRSRRRGRTRRGRRARAARRRSRPRGRRRSRGRSACRSPWPGRRSSASSGPAPGRS